MKKSKIITTSSLFSKEKKPGKKPIITTKDLSDEQIHNATTEQELKPIIKTPHSQEKRDNEKEQKD